MELQDQSDIYDLIKKYPDQFERGFRIAETVRLPKAIDQVVISAFSYNAAIAETVKNLYARDLPVPLQIHSGYGLPAQITPQTLVVAISLCGQRPEVLSAVQMAYKAGLKLIIVTAGGELEVFARERGLPLILLDKNIPEYRPAPAGGSWGAGLMIAILVHILIGAGLFPAKTRQQILAATKGIENMYLPRLGRKIADLITDTNVLVYSSEKYYGLAIFMKNIINILGGMPCFANTFSGGLGTEIHGFSRKGFAKYFALILNDNAANKNIKFSAKQLEEKLSAAKIKNYILDLPGQNQLEKTLATPMLIYWIAYWLIYPQK
ncbi:MAG: SIS domain-containing protein [Patescibacteria group bacterium]